MMFYPETVSPELLKIFKSLMLESEFGDFLLGGVLHWPCASGIGGQLIWIFSLFTPLIYSRLKIFCIICLPILKL